MKKNNKQKILLGLLPYWTPQIPPVGIACLKGFLQDHGYRVKAFDVNVEEKIRNLYDAYFDTLRESISEKKRGNFYNIGHEVMQNQMMAHLFYQDEKEYINLVKILVRNTYYFDIDDERVLRLIQGLDEFYGFLEDYMLDLLERETPDVLGLSSYKGNLPAVVFISKLAKERFPGIKTVMGGSVFAQTLGIGTPDFDSFLEKTAPYIDHLVVGEGELLFLKLLQGELSQRVLTLKDIDNQTLDLGSAVLPDFSDYRLEVYPNMASYTSRSCPYQCSFCTETVYWGKYRKKPANQIVNELSTLYHQHGSQLFLLSDSLLNPVITGLAKEFLERDLPIYWDGYLRVDKNTCHQEKVFLWRRGGFYRGRLGVESGSQRMLDAMNKKIPIQDIKTTLSNLANAGIKTTNYFIIGYPGETEADFQQTLDFIEELRDDIYEAECNPFGYYLEGQVDSEKWKQTKKNIRLYPEEAKDMLILQTWSMDCEPKREVVYERINRFVRHCTRLGVPNPYSLYDIYMADDRWKKLHKNAVPSLVEFKDKQSIVDEVKNVKELFYIKNTWQTDIGFNF